MWPFNKTKFYGLFLSLSVVACSMGTPQERENPLAESATFLIDQTEVSVIGLEKHSALSLPLAKVYSFKACLKDSRYSKPIQNQKFEISGGSQTSTASTDSAGCLTWNEKISYNHLADAHWIEAVRTLTAQGLQKGQKKLKWALNPWENQGESFLNKKILSLVPAEQAQAVLEKETTQGLWVDDLRLTVDEKKITSEGVYLGIEIRTLPNWAVQKTSGRVLEPITEGEFEAEMILINVLNENGREVRRSLSKPVLTEGRIVNNSLLLQSDQILLKPASRYGQIQLGLIIRPKNGPKNLGSFEGAFAMGEYDQIKGSSFSRLKNSFQDKQGALKLSQYVTESAVPALNLGTENSELTRKTEQSTGYQKSQVQIAPLDLNHVGYRHSKGQQREMIFSVTACMMGPLDSKPLRAQNFEIQKTNGSSESLRSNDKGCVTWEDSLAFNYLDAECWISKPVRIANTNFGMNQTLELQLNPWSEGHSGLRDSRQIGKRELTCASGSSKIVLFHYEFDKKQVQYPIDSFLNIKVQKEGIFKLQARLKRPSLTDPTGYEDTSLPPGPYRLRWAIVDQQVQDFNKAENQIYQVQEKTVQIDSSGTVAESLQLESPNLRALGNTNWLLLEISPSESHSNLSVATYRGPLVLANSDDSGNLELLRESQESLIAKLGEQLKKDQLAQKQNLEQLVSKQAFASRENLAVINLNQETESLPLRKALSFPSAWKAEGQDVWKKMSVVSRQELIQWQNSGKMNPELGRRFCGFWFYDQLQRPLASRGGVSLLQAKNNDLNRLLEQCYEAVRQNPRNFFDLQYRYFLKSPQKVKNLTAEIKDLNFNSAFTLSQAHDLTFTKTASADVNFGFSFSKWLSPFSIGGGFRYQIARADSERQGAANSTVIQSGESLQLEKLNFQIQAQGYEKCAVIRLNSELLNPDKSNLKKIMSRELTENQIQRELSYGLMFCDGEVRERRVNFQESYYILNQKITSTQALDSNSNLARPLFMAVRGHNDFRRLMNLLGGQIKTPGTAQLDSQVQNTGKTPLAPIFAQGIPTYPSQYVADE